MHPGDRAEQLLLLQQALCREEIFIKASPVTATSPGLCQHQLLSRSLQVIETDLRENTGEGQDTEPLYTPFLLLGCLQMPELQLSLMHTLTGADSAAGERIHQEQERKQWPRGRERVKEKERMGERDGQ